MQQRYGFDLEEGQTVKLRKNKKVTLGELDRETELFKYFHIGDSIMAFHKSEMFQVIA